jgi:hypothetical protein
MDLFELRAVACYDATTGGVSWCDHPDFDLSYGTDVVFVVPRYNLFRRF